MKRTINYLSSVAIAIALISVVSCKDDELPKIDGYNNSNEVAADNLVAHWTFDSDNKESISGTAPSSTFGTVSSETGQIGKALKLTQGFLVYPTISALSSADALPSVTVSLWVKIANNGTSQSNIFGITQSTATQTDWNTGPLNVYIETGNHPVGNDTLQLHSNFATYIDGARYNGDNVNNYGVKGTDYLPFASGADEWFHYVMRYDGGGSLIDLYANGVRVSNNNFRHRTYSPGGVETGLGNLTITPPTMVVIGAWPNNSAGFTNSSDQGWQSVGITASIDEIRVFNSSLSETEIGALYNLGIAGR